MKNFIIMIVSYSIMGIAFTYLYKLMIKHIIINFDKYFQEKFNGFEAKDIFIEPELAKRLEFVCKRERRQRTDQINLILDEWLTKYEQEHNI